MEPLRMGVDYSTRKVAVALVGSAAPIVRSWAAPPRNRLAVVESINDVCTEYSRIVVEMIEQMPSLVSSLGSVSVEHPIVGGSGNRQTAIGMAMVAGALVRETGMMLGIKPEMVHVSSWKKVVCGNGGLDKSQVGEWLRDHHQDLWSATANDDEVDAVCLAMYGALCDA